MDADLEAAQGLIRNLSGLIEWAEGVNAELAELRDEVHALAKALRHLDDEWRGWLVAERRQHSVKVAP